MSNLSIQSSIHELNMALIHLMAEDNWSCDVQKMAAAGYKRQPDDLDALKEMHDQLQKVTYATTGKFVELQEIVKQKLLLKNSPEDQKRLVQLQGALDNVVLISIFSKVPKYELLNKLDNKIDQLKTVSPKNIEMKPYSEMGRWTQLK